MCGGCYDTQDHQVQAGPKLTRRALLKGLAGGTAMAAVPACDTVAEAFTPSRTQMAAAAGPAWVDLKKKQKVSTDPRYTRRVNRVAPKILRAAGENPANWEVVTFADKSLNAFALPGNKIGIYTGILDIMENDDQIAVVMGHEVAHVQLNHSGQRYGQQSAAQFGLAGAGAILDSRSPQNSRAIQQALGFGAQVGYLLPFNRSHETEADIKGVRFMPKAGYDPRQAIKFWGNMAKASSGSQLEFLSTHPSHGTRIETLKAEIQAMGYKL